MKKAKIYIPTKTAMQSGRGKLKKWVLEFVTKDSSINPLMGWESSIDTLSEVKLKFSTKDLAIDAIGNDKIHTEPIFLLKVLVCLQDQNFYCSFDIQLS